MEKLVQVIGPQLRLVKSGQPMEIPERQLSAEQDEEFDGIERLQPTVHSTLPICDVCRQQYGGTQYGLLKRAVHGPETGWKNVLEPCPKCSPAALLLREEEKARKNQLVLDEIFGQAQIPWQAEEWEFSNFPGDGDMEALALVKAFVAMHLNGDRRSNRGLYLGGKLGRGKTSLAISAIKEVMRESQQSCLYVMSMELMDRLRATYDNKDHSGAITYDALINAVCSVPWLVLDDLAVERPTPYVLEKLHYIIEKRRSLGLYTIITSNLSTSALETYWRPEDIPKDAFHPGQRVVERIREYCRGVGVKGPNLREGSF